MEHLLWTGKRTDICGQGAGKMGVGCAVLLEMKITDNCYARTMLGYKVLSTKAPSKHQGGIALLWKPDHEAFEVKAT
jgi:hypothetical protein